MKRELPHYELKLVDGAYLDAYNHRDTAVERVEAMRLYRLFWLDDAGRVRPGIHVTYLNVFDKTGEFEFQVYYEHGKFFFGNTPYY